MKNYRSRNPHTGEENAYAINNITLFPLLLIAGTIVQLLPAAFPIGLPVIRVANLYAL
jgi:hypothetical protein